MWKVFSQSGLQTALTTISRPVKPTPGEEVEGEEKQGLGNVQTRPFVFPLTFKRVGNETAVSKMTCNIPCQETDQKDVLKADS